MQSQIRAVDAKVIHKKCVPEIRLRDGRHAYMVWNNLECVVEKITYSLRPIILFANMNVSRHILVVDISVLAKSNMDRREY
jgi:hypothetical protein